MKKVLSFVLVLSMILGSFGMAFAAPADVVGKDYEDAVNVLVELGVVAGYEDGSYRPANVVTRAEMATFIIKAMGLADYAVEKSAFTDMAGHWADPFVAYAASLGFVKGNTDGTFAPDATVSYDQAITMLVQALGYQAEYLTGGYPGAFVNQAKTLGMLDGVKSGVAGANRGDVAVLLYNTLDCGFVRYTKDGALEFTGSSMMARLAEVEYTSTFIVDEAYTGLVDMKDYLGAYVEAYMNEDDEVIAVKEVKSVFLTGKVNEDGKFETADTKYTINDGYYVSSGAVTTRPAVYFVNGDSAEGATTSTMAVAIDNTVTIAAKVSGKTIKEIYSIADWDAKATIIWDEDAAEILAEDKEIAGAVFALDDSEEIDADVFVLEGVEALADIKEDAIVTVYEATVDSEEVIVKVAVSTAVVEGKVAKDKDGDFTINGKIYNAATALSAYEVSNETGDTVELGAEGKFFLNAAGDIAYFEATKTTADKYAMVTYDMETVSGEYGEDGTIKVKLLTADGKEAVYVVKNDEVVKTTGSAATQSALTSGTVVSYNINKDGKLDLVRDWSTATNAATNLTKKGYLDGVKVASDVVVFTKNTDGDFVVAALADVPVDTNLGSSEYILNKDGLVAVIVLDENVTDNEDSVFAVLVDYALVRNADDDGNIYEVTMLVGKDTKTFKTTDATQKFTTDGALFELVFDGADVDAFNVTGTSIAAATTTVEAIKDGNVKVAGTGVYTEVADDVIVYEYDADKETMAVSSLAKIVKGDYVVLIEVDGAADDKDYVDYVIFRSKN